MRPYLLPHLLASAADAHPDHTAVVDGGRTLTYAELDAASNRLARLIVELGIRRGDRVGVYLRKSPEALVGIYGILKAGAAYVPLDSEAPPARLGYIAANCEIRCLVTARDQADNWAALLHSGAPLESLVVLNDGAPPVDVPGVRVLGSDAVEQQPDLAATVPGINADLAYILYTSGSTGSPKGVMLSHQNALAFIEWAVECFDVRHTDRLSSHAPLHFDLSIFDLFAAASAGAAVVLVPPEASIFPRLLVDFISEQEISTWYSVPSVLSLLAVRGGLTGDEFPSLRTVLFAGEVFPTKYLRRLMELFPHARFSNLYGPTETNVCTYYDVPPLSADDVAPIPVGRAIDGVEVIVVGDDGAPVRPGEVGELYVRGPTVMRGYWGDPQRTSAVLVPNPFQKGCSDHVYRTGDLVREEAGNLLFLGRRDSQIKSRGYRIELGEIESVLSAHPEVVECAVTAVPDPLLTNTLKAFIAMREPVDERELISFCAQRLPRYMIPDAIEFRERLPKTSTGKIDRQLLVEHVTQEQR